MIVIELYSQRMRLQVGISKILLLQAIPTQVNGLVLKVLYLKVVRLTYTGAS